MTREQLEAILENEEEFSSKLDCLDNRELEVVSMMSQGQNGRQISEELQIGPEELKTLKASIQKKCGLKDEVALVQFAAQQRTRDISSF